MAPFRLWVEAARPRTLTAAIVPVVVGTAAAGRLIAPRFVATLIVAVAIQVGTNFANDVFDAQRGVDTPERVGPRRLTAAGLMAPEKMKRATAAAFGVAVAAGLPLVYAIGPELLPVGVASVLAALAYSGGRKPYGSKGLGELFVFVFFGLVATTGAAYVQAEEVLGSAIAAAVPVGCLATAILVANNYRDLATDAAAGKRTLAVRLGASRTRIFYRFLVVVSFAACVGVAAAAGTSWPLVALAAAPLAVRPWRAFRPEASPSDVIASLSGTAALETGYGALLALGLWVR